VGFQRSLGREVFEYDKEGISAKIIKHNLRFGRSYLYIPRGPGVDFNMMSGGFKNPINNFVVFLKELARANKSIFIKSEPLADSVAQALVESGRFKKSKKEIQPSKTTIINLEADELDILSNMHNKTRYNIKVAEKNGVIVKESQDTEAFLDMLHKTTKRDNFSGHPDGYYHKLLNDNSLNTKLFIAFYENKPIAGAITLTYGDVGYYLHGASDYEHRALMAPYMLHWQIMQYFKRAGVKNYDMWGIDARRWPGVTRFKLGWGGRTVEYPGSFDLPIARLWYLAYKIARKII